MKDLDEAIKHCEEKAEELRKQSDGFVLCTNVKKECLKCAEEHKQLAEWLKQLKAIKEAYKTGEVINVVAECMSIWGE